MENTNSNYCTISSTNLNTFSDTSSINEKQRKLFLKINSLIASAENFESLKIYEDSLKLFSEANNLVKSLSKKQIIEESPQVKKFFAFFESHTKSKIKILEQLVCIKKICNDKNFKSEKNKSLLQADPKLFIPISEQKSHNLNRSEILEIAENLIKCCEKNLKEIEELKKNAIPISNQIQNVNVNFTNMNTPFTNIQMNKSILLETTFINQNSFYLPNIQNFVNSQQEDFGTPKNPNWKLTSRNEINLLDNFSLIERIQENFEFIQNKLNKFKNLLEKETILKEKKKYKQEKLEKLKQSYSMMKKIYENAVRGGIKII